MRDRLDKLLYEVDDLDPESKALLVKRLLGNSGIHVTFGGNSLSAPVIIQINAMDKDVIADILESVATKFTK